MIAEKASDMIMEIDSVEKIKEYLKQMIIKKAQQVIILYTSTYNGI